MPAPDEPDPRLHHYLCSYCDHIFTAPADSIDRTRMVRCPTCAAGDERSVSVPVVRVPA